MHIILPRLYSNSNISHGEPASPSSSTLNHFHLFPNLPNELRYKIWHTAIQPRVLEPFLDFPNDGQKPQFPRRRPPPALFSTTHESRRICLDEYLVRTLCDKPFYIHPHLDTLFIPLNNPITESLSYIEPFYQWLISQVSTIALEISIDSSLLTPMSRIYRMAPAATPPMILITPSREGNMWLYYLVSPSATLYLTFQLNPTRPKSRATPPPQSPSSLESPYPVSSSVNKYADRTIITKYEEECGTNLIWSKLLPKSKVLPDPMAIVRKQQMALRLESEKTVLNNVSYMTHKVLRE